MRTLAAKLLILLVGVLSLTGCGANDPGRDYDTAMEQCVEMATEAMPNGMQDPDDPSAVLNSEQFCERLAAGYTREKFAELYTDPEWLANELEIWSDEGIE